MFQKFTFLVLFVIFPCFALAQSWSLISQLPAPSSDINSICVVDSNVIWVSCVGGYLYRSTDGALTWQDKSPSVSLDLFGVSAVDSMSCWVGTSDGTVARTTDGGSTWTPQINIAGSYINGIKMFDAQNGVFMGDDVGMGQVYQLRYTTDGGDNWLLSSTSPQANNEYGIINAWDWTDQNHFWIGTQNYDQNAPEVRLIHTVTGFQGTFTSINIQGEGGANGLGIPAIAFTDSLHGIIGSRASDSDFIKITTDGGTSWETADVPDSSSSFDIACANGLKDGSDIIRVLVADFANSEFKLFRTTDYGTTWTEEMLPAEAAANGFRQMEFLNDSLGFAGCIGGYIIKYSTSQPSGVISTNITPSKFILNQNYPNPFNPTTLISYSLPSSGNVSLKVYDVLGKEVKTLVNGFQQAGLHSISFNASALPSGVYFYRMEAANRFTSVKKMILLR